MKSIYKSYPGVQALKGVSLRVDAGEVHALVGENGAGKSTLMKILSGAEPMDSGQIFLDGQPITISSPMDAQKLGIIMIYQEFNLIPQMSVAENIFLGREPVHPKSSWLKWKIMRREAAKFLEKLNAPLNVRAPVSSLSVAEQQIVEIARALSQNARIIIMDEPSATLTEHELTNLFQTIRELAASGVAVIYISHRLGEIFEICQRVTILRDGSWIASEPLENLTQEKIVQMMVGRSIGQEFPREKTTPGDILLELQGVTSGKRVKNVSLQVRAGEIVGIAGLVGSGRTELAKAILGALPVDSGEIRWRGEPIFIRSPREAIAKGLALIPEDRKREGLVLGLSVRHNATLSSLSRFLKWEFIRPRRENQAVRQMVQDLRIKTPTLDQHVRFLSGGNQQKVVLAKGLLTRSRLLIFDEPTRGIDVGAKQEIYQLMNRLTREGIGILMISSELPEVLGMSDRILVMHEGKIRGELTRQEATQEKIMALATGATGQNQ